MKEIYTINKLDLSDSSLTLSSNFNGELITIDLYNIKSIRADCDFRGINYNLCYITVSSSSNFTNTYKLFNPYGIDIIVNPQYNDEEIAVTTVTADECESMNIIYMILSTPGVRLLPGCRIEILSKVNLKLVNGKFIQRKLNTIKTYIKDQLLSESEAL